MSLEIIRPRSVSVSHETFWKLMRVAKALAGLSGPMETSQSADAIAERFIKERLDADYPTLGAIYKERKAADDKAVEAVQQATEKPQ